MAFRGIDPVPMWIVPDWFAVLLERMDSRRRLRSTVRRISMRLESVLFRKGGLVGCGGRQNQLEQGPVFAVRRCSKLAAMLLDDHAGNGKSQSHSARFRRDKRIKYAL